MPSVFLPGECGELGVVVRGKFGARGRTEEVGLFRDGGGGRRGMDILDDDPVDRGGYKKTTTQETVKARQKKKCGLLPVVGAWPREVGRSLESFRWRLESVLGQRWSCGDSGW